MLGYFTAGKNHPAATSRNRIRGLTPQSYDTRDRLLQEQTTRLGGYTSTFAYDAAGNPTVFKSSTRTYNLNNQLTGTGYAYDLNGNPTTYSGSGLTFDPENRLTVIGSLLSAGYRSDGLRAWRQGSVRTYTIYDGDTALYEVNSSGVVQGLNIFGGDGLQAWQSGGTTTHFVFDQQGNVAQRLDGSQAILNSSAFDAYGVESATSTPSDPFGYNAQSGYLLDRDTGLYLCEHRYYDAATGRWITRDPIGYEGGINLYGYTSGNPIGRSDLDGFDWIEYTGQKYTWYLGSLGNRSCAKFSVPATSGGIGLQEPAYAGTKGSDTDGPLGGPIPNALYKINLQLNPNRIASKGPKPDQYLYSGVGIQRIPSNAKGTLYPAWGTWRARLELRKGNSLHRGNMYLHDSGKGFSHGCVETRRLDGFVVLRSLINYRNQGHSKIDVLVRYTGSSTRGDTVDNIWSRALGGG